MYLGYQGEKIALVANTREELENNQYMIFDNIVETIDEYVMYNGEYLIKSEADTRKAADEKEAKLKDLYKQLDTIDLKAIRALRAIQAGVGTEADTQRIAALEEQAEEIREELRQLGVM